MTYQNSRCLPTPFYAKRLGDPHRSGAENLAHCKVRWASATSCSHRNTQGKKKKEEEKKKVSVDGGVTRDEKSVWVVRSGGRTGRPFKSAYL